MEPTSKQFTMSGQIMRQSPVSEVDSQNDAKRAERNGHRLGDSDVKAANLADTPVSGSAMAKSAKAKKDIQDRENYLRSDEYLQKKAITTRGSGIIEKGKLIKGGNIALANSLHEKSKKSK